MGGKEEDNFLVCTKKVKIVTENVAVSFGANEKDRSMVYRLRILCTVRVCPLFRAYRQ
jgi:hypothetical protein